MLSIEKAWQNDFLAFLPPLNRAVLREFAEINVRFSRLRVDLPWECIANSIIHSFYWDYKDVRERQGNKDHKSEILHRMSVH